MDARLANGFLLNTLQGDFTVLAINTAPPDISEVGGINVQTITLDTSLDDPHGDVAARYLGHANSCVYLIRPDQHIVARWPVANSADIEIAVRIATGQKG